ncbi:MAG: RHS repeat-associated core domain-containing protein, partial [Bacteroidota bacterium]
YFQKEGQDMLLQNVVDGHNKRINFTYRRMTQTSNFYSRPTLTDYPRNTVTAPIYLAQQMERDDGIGGYFTTRYKYEDAFVHRAGKGFLGFREVHTIDLDNDLRTEVEREQTPGIYMLAPHETRKYVSSTDYLFHQTDFDITFLPQGNESYWPRFNGSTEDRILQDQTIVMSYGYDNYGNVTLETEDNGVETITTDSEYFQYAGPVPNRKTRMIVTRQRTGQPSHTFTDRYYYNNKGQLTSRIDYDGLPRQVATIYVYDDFGNVTLTTVAPIGLVARQTINTYDPKGRFVVGLTNQMGHTESATYDAKWGEKLTVTGVDGLTTTFEYDAFGRRSRTILPTAVMIDEAYPFFVSPSYGSIYYHSISQVGKPDQQYFFDKLGRRIRHHRRSFANDMIYEVWTYDSRGRPKTARAPYKSSETTFTTTYNYDTYNRRTSEVNPFGTTTYSYSYSGGNAKITKTNPAGQVSTVEMDASGLKTKATDTGGTLNYTYDSQGLLKEVKLGSTTMVTLMHDVYGNKIQVVDKNAGTISYGYNAFKELISETNANGHTYQMEYNKLSQLTRRYGPGEDRRYEYHTSGVAKGKIFHIHNLQSTDAMYYYYDIYGRVRTVAKRVDGPYLWTSFTYNAFNDLTSKTYPSGLKLDYLYDSNGILSSIKHVASNHTLFTNQAMNGRGQYTSYQLGNNVTTTVEYNQGITTRYLAPGQQDLRMNWNYDNGNLIYRWDDEKGRFENFTYDGINRLLTSQVAGQAVKSTSYASNGNINTKSDVGTYTYASMRNNAVEKVTNPDNTIPALTQDIVYNEFDQPSKLTEGDFELDYTYGHDRQRIKSVLKENGLVTRTRLYFGEYEQQIQQGNTQHIHYVNAGQGTVGIVVMENNNFEFYATYTDHLGSIVRVTDDTGGMVAEQSFDAWGRKRNASTWTYANVGSVPDWLYRGYTGHEEMPKFQLINMNGRMYDPVVGRMLSPDNHVQSPTNTQSYNRYTYAFNNPLSYTDPSGEIAWFIPVIIGAAVGAYAGASIASGNWNFTKWNKNAWKGAIVGAFIGAAAGASIAASVNATGITKAGSEKLSTAWKITTAAIKGANIKLAVTSLTGGDLNKLYKSALVGAALGGYKSLVKTTKGFGLIDKFGWKAALLEKALYTTVESLAGNWINGDKIFYNVVVGVGPLRFTFGKKYGNPIFRWQDNIGSLLAESLSLLKLADGGSLKFDLQKLTLVYGVGKLSNSAGLGDTVNSVTWTTSDWISFLGQYLSKK